MNGMDVRGRLHKCFKNRNDGVSLIEVLISMFILAIIVVPLLSQFVVSAETNVKSRKHQNATTITQNIMEGIKEYGLNKTAVQFYQTGAGTKPKLEFINESAMDMENGSNYYELAGSTGTDALLDESKQSVIDGKFVGRPGGQYYYAIFGIQEGISKYDVRISFDSSPYKGEDGKMGPNDYAFPDVSALAAKTTAFINPSVIISSSSYDDMALEYYKVLHQQFAYKTWEAEQKEIADQNKALIIAYEKAYQEWQNNGETGPAPSYPNLLPLPESPDVFDEGIIKKEIKRRLEIMISDQLENDQHGNPVTKICLDARIVYEFDNKGLIDFGGQSLERVNTGFCDHLTYDRLTDIYLFFSIMGGLTPIQEQNTIRIDDRRSNAAKEKINLFIPVQSGDEKSNKKIKVEFTEGSSYIELFSQIELDTTGSLVTKHIQLLKEFEAADRIYDVKIEVFEAGTGFGEWMATLDSTIIQ